MFLLLCNYLHPTCTHLRCFLLDEWRNLNDRESIKHTVFENRGNLLSIIQLTRTWVWLSSPSSISQYNTNWRGSQSGIFRIVYCIRRDAVERDGWTVRHWCCLITPVNQTYFFHLHGNCFFMNSYTCWYWISRRCSLQHYLSSHILSPTKPSFSHHRPTWTEKSPLINKRDL